MHFGKLELAGGCSVIFFASVKEILSKNYCSPIPVLHPALSLGLNVAMIFYPYFYYHA